MNIKEIRQLVKLMIENGLTELDLAEGERKVHLKRGPEPSLAAPAVASLPAVSEGPAPAPAAEPAAEALLEIRSPMVGTFYASSGPDSEPFVEVGSGVAEDSVVCIVEAMKVMNEIKADCAGTIAEICVRNEQPVEYGQVLFRVRPA